MTRNEALEKINKCIALATNAGATDGEKQNAWAMAEKLASKYGFKIVKQEAPKATDINLRIEVIVLECDCCSFAE